ncbi:diaminobutyrate--2-oxoglutarate transaminase [Fontibacillus panacisegetis]|uniref:diaminobutyrate--2-oxoglutarate transaminase n=1 Tax=Fontibacillus panacisegetis TaxID=670482 RepID=UPI000B8994F1|nr:diaminobutyrate--2-oxoglutarate transaminase [Fontibacillus panacisegetis]
MNAFELYESNVRSYCRSFSDVFLKAKDDVIYSETGKKYIDFFAGAGALNYGHNNDYIKEQLLTYINDDGLTHGLDMYTVAKREFVTKFVERILKPRDLEYKLQFCGATGTNAVEAALKLARKVKKRTNIFSFMGSFHGMSLGSLSATSNKSSREGAGMPLNQVTFMPHPFGLMNHFDTIQYIESILLDDHSGIEKPAAIIFETVQAEGGVNPVSEQWLRRLADLCKRHDILLICDDIQVGCGRTGTFFSFERAGIVPDMVTLSKSISGYGLPMSLLLLKPELDEWKPGEHNGTFRGNQMAFVTACAALELREKLDLDNIVMRNERFIQSYLEKNIGTISEKIEIRGLGMIWGIDLSKIGDSALSKKIVLDCFDKGLILERAGREDSVVKLLPPLTITADHLERGCEILSEVMHSNIVGCEIASHHNVGGEYFGRK